MVGGLGRSCAQPLCGVAGRVNGGDEGGWVGAWLAPFPCAASLGPRERRRRGWVGRGRVGARPGAPLRWPRERRRRGWVGRAELRSPRCRVAGPRQRRRGWVGRGRGGGVRPLVAISDQRSNTPSWTPSTGSTPAGNPQPSSTGSDPSGCSTLGVIVPTNVEHLRPDQGCSTLGVVCAPKGRTPPAGTHPLIAAVGAAGAQRGGGLGAAPSAAPLIAAVGAAGAQRGRGVGAAPSAPPRNRAVGAAGGSGGGGLGAAPSAPTP